MQQLGPPPALACAPRRQMICLSLRRFWGGLLLLLAVLPALGAPFDMSPVRIGVLAFRPIDQTLAQWSPTANYLEGELAGRPVEIVPVTLDNIEQVVAGRQVEFLLANPEQYVVLASRHRLAAVATLLADIDGRPFSRFGGVIFVRDERADIAELKDLRDKTVAAVSDKSFAGFLAQRWVLQRAGVDLQRDAGRLLLTGLPQDKVVHEVLAGRADVGFIRTGVLESMEREGKVKAGELRAINLQAESLYPQKLSTELYPEWPLAAMPGVPDSLVKSITLALYRLPAGHPAAKAGRYYGFAPPGDYASVEALLHRLHLHPDRLQHFGVAEIVGKYFYWLIAGGVLLLVLVVAVITVIARKNHRLRKALMEAERLALRDDLLTSLSEGVYGVDRSGKCTFINPAALEMLGFEREQVVGYDQHALFHHHYPDGRPYPAGECPIRQTLEDGRARRTEETFFRADRSPVLVRQGVHPVRHGEQIVGAVVAFQDVSAQKEAEEKIRNMALHDALTGLPNRRLLSDRLDQALARADRSSHGVAVLFLDLDGFKPINDACGHDAGDAVLVAVSRRLEAGVRAVDTVCRLAGDEFVVVLADLQSRADAEAVAEKLVEAIAAPIEERGDTRGVTVSIGLAIFPEHGKSVEALLRAADQGMYAAKHGGKNCGRGAGPGPVVN